MEYYSSYEFSKVIIHKWKSQVNKLNWYDMSRVRFRFALDCWNL